MLFYNFQLELSAKSLIPLLTMYVSKTTCNVFIGCCASAFLMEILMANAPETANLVTFLQFFFISVQGFVLTAKYGTVKPKIPLRQYTILVTLFFVTSVLNNYVYVLHVPSTLHMIIRSASSPASLLVYCYAKQVRPNLNKGIGSLLITVGVFLATIGGASTVEQSSKFGAWCLGVTILVSTLVLGAYTGLQQETLFSKYGKHPDEMLFYTHAIPLPLFTIIAPQMHNIGSNLSWGIWCIIGMNIVSQFYCTHSVHALATKETSVTVTFILTIRKFVSLMISSIFFKNNLTYLHFFGTVFVIIGTFIYFDLFVTKKQVPVNLKENQM